MMRQHSRMFPENTGTQTRLLQPEEHVALGYHSSLVRTHVPLKLCSTLQLSWPINASWRHLTSSQWTLLQAKYSKIQQKYHILSDSTNSKFYKTTLSLWVHAHTSNLVSKYQVQNVWATLRYMFSKSLAYFHSWKTDGERFVISWLTSQMPIQPGAENSVQVSQMGNRVSGPGAGVCCLPGRSPARGSLEPETTWVQVPQAVTQEAVTQRLHLTPEV